MAGRCRHCGARVGGIGSSTTPGARIGHYEHNCSSNPNNRDAPKPPPKSRRFQVPTGKLGLSVPTPPAPRIKKINSPDSSVLSIAEQLVLLAQLRDSGALTEQEFQSLKSRLISGA